MKILAEHPDSRVTISTTLRTVSALDPVTQSLAGFEYVALKNAVLGKRFECSLVFAGSQRIQTLNRTYRDIDKPTDVLSFSYSNESGEVVICPEIARNKASDFDRDLPHFLAFLFIHGCFHLKGMEHGGRMEQSEARIRRRFQV
ncbi:MAG: rRNA maturation RNase YbeY [Candidatus Paceibacterota bacterium]